MLVSKDTYVLGIIRTLQKTVYRLCKSGRYFTNHSLHAITATRLFEANVDEQLIIQRTGHMSSAVRSYKQIGEL